MKKYFSTLSNLKKVKDAKYTIRVMQKTLKDTSEFQDSSLQIQEKLLNSIQKLKQSQYPIILTGAGVSTDSNIPDYRSGFQTVLKTGPGKWETEENKNKYIEKKGQSFQRTMAINAIPNQNHMIISELVNAGIFKNIITSNVDNLHFKSGVPKQKIVELHGNISYEYCPSCNRNYFRDYECPDYKRLTNQRENDLVVDHLTKRECLSCKSQLKDSLIYFGEFMKPSINQKALEIQNKADFLFVLGTSLHVQSSAIIVKRAIEKNLPILIMNLQKTPYDNKEGVVKINGTLDNMLPQMASMLGIQPNSQSQIIRYIQISYILQNLDHIQIEIKSEDWEMKDRCYIKQATIHYLNHNQQENKIVLDREYNGQSIIIDLYDCESIIDIKLKFYNQLNEPNYIYHPETLENGKYFSKSNQNSIIFLRTKLEFNQNTKQWIDSHTKDTYK